MSRLEDAERRLRNAISRLGRAVETRLDAEKDQVAVIDDLKSQVEQAEYERDYMEKRMNTAALRVGETIERLRGALND
ncbi:MAG: hypothetical protein VX085_18510 [Pseudomonadota bacterium]|nr:hypothetical protein [Pseudomonadota bacterium]